MSETSAAHDSAWFNQAQAITPLLSYAAGEWGGEAGVIEKVFSILPERAGFAVEFGQRRIGSGTVAELISHRGWGALYLDREPRQDLETRPAADGRTITLARANLAPSNINHIFAQHGVPNEFDCLVIDIDGLDYWVWEAIAERWSPSLVIIEFNAHVGHGIEATIHADESWAYGRTKDYGASIAAFESLAERKGYRLVHVHGCWNLYFVRDELDFPDELRLRTPASEADLSLLTDTDAFYDTLCGPGERPSWATAPPPDVSRAPWELLAPPVKSTLVDLEGIEIDVVADKHDATWYRQRKTFEEKASLLYPMIADADFRNFVDIGANIGLISILARRSAPGIRTVAVEADPSLVRLLRGNFSRNGLDDAEVISAAAGAENRASVGFSLNPTSTLDNRVSVAEWPTVHVPMVRMDRVLAELGLSGPTFFKVDTQGFEQQVIRGLEHWLSESPDWVLKMEFAPWWLRSQGTDPAALLDYLLQRYEIAEFPARLPFGTAGFDGLFAAAVRPDQRSEFLAHIEAQDANGRGWVDLIVRPQPSKTGADKRPLSPTGA